MYEIEGADSYDNYVYATVTNDTDEEIYGAYISLALLDSEGHIAFVANNSYDTLGIHPNSTVTVKMYIDNDVIKYYLDS